MCSMWQGEEKEMKIILYKGASCPKCKVIAAKLDAKGIEYETCMDMDLMLSKGIKAIPTLDVDGILYRDIRACNDWIKSLEAAE